MRFASEEPVNVAFTGSFLRRAYAIAKNAHEAFCVFRDRRLMKDGKFRNCQILLERLVREHCQPRFQLGSRLFYVQRAAPEKCSSLHAGNTGFITGIVGALIYI